MDSETARLSRTVDQAALGQRIRNARLAAGLTQSEAAGDEVSAAYISRIEVGSRRPDTRLLQYLADKFNTTVEALVLGVNRDVVAEVELALDYAELSLKSGDAASALEQVDELSSDQNRMTIRPLLDRSSRLRANSLEALGRYAEAIEELERQTAADRRDAWWLRAHIALSRCHRETGDLTRAIDAGRTALDEVEELGLGGTDEAVQLALTVSAAHFERGDISHAMTLCEQTVAKAELMASPKARASAYWNASLMQTRQGHVEAAMPMARKAIEIMEQGDDARNLARLRGALASIQLRQDPPDLEGAGDNARLALRDMEWSDASAVDQARVRLTLAKTDYLAGRNSEARESATECFESARDVAPLLAAEASVVLGRISLVDQEANRARRHFQQAVLLLTAIGADRKAAEMWYELGGLMLQVGDQSGALDAYQRAGASSGLVQPTGLGLPAAPSLPSV